MEKTFKAGVAQFDIVNGDVEANMASALLYLEELADKGAQLAVLPEMFSTGFDNENIKMLSQSTPDCLEQLADLAKKQRMAIAGSLPQKKGQEVFNTLFLIDREGQIKGAYQKLHLFRLTREHEFFSAGDQVVSADMEWGRIGLMICYDLRFPELARSLFISGVNIFIVPAQWPSPRAEHWRTLVRARAVENQAYVIAANRTGVDGDLNFPGLSTIVDPSGTILVQKGDSPGTDLAEIDLNLVREMRESIPVLTDRREDVYGS